MTNQEKKKAIRREILAARNQLPREEWEKGTLLLTERILGHQWFYRCEYFLCYVSTGSEIGTTELIREALQLGKKVFVPKVDQETKEPTMDFFRIESLEELVDGYYGIKEPTGTSEKYCYEEALADRTLLLVPGVAFDQCRNRIGYGKGFYDRYLREREKLQIYSIGVGFTCQLVEEIPTQELDMRPYQVICV